MTDYIGYQVHYFSHGYFTGAEDRVHTVDHARRLVANKYSHKDYEVTYTGEYSGVITSQSEPWVEIKFGIRGVDSHYKARVL